MNGMASIFEIDYFLVRLMRNLMNFGAKGKVELIL